MQLVIVTGLSGSGKSVALHSLEDIGFYCIDNLPLFLLPALANSSQIQQQRTFDRMAVGIDARSASHSDLGNLPGLVASLRQEMQCELIYLEARQETLIRRFNETRRRHPLSLGQRTLAEAIQLERNLLEPVLDAADLRIDTTHTNLHQLRKLIGERLGTPRQGGMSLLFQSFGFKHGVPSDVDFVFDARCLPNPYWQPQLRRLNGRDPEVISFLEHDPKVQQFQEQVTAFCSQWIPSFAEQGRSYMTIAIGCTGGQHRSVYLAEKLAEHFRRNNQQAQIRHREFS